MDNMEITSVLEPISWKMTINIKFSNFLTDNLPSKLMSQLLSAESMELFTLWKWRLMVDHKNILLIKQVLNMEQDTVMLNVLMTLNSSMEKLTQKTGKMIKVTMDLAVQSLMFGKPINTPMLTLLILAKLQVTTGVKEANVVMAVKDKMVFVIKMAAI